MHRALLVLIFFSGCAIPLNGEWPIPRGDAGDRWVEVGGGEEAVIVSSGSTHRIISARGIRELHTSVNLEGAQALSGHIYRLEDGDLLEETLAHGRLEDPRLVAHVERATRFALAGPYAALAAPGVVVAGPPSRLRGIWEGDAAALAIDARRKLVWIAARAPLGVIDCVGLDDGRVRLRVPLPQDLESSALRIVLSGECAAVYALDRPIDRALLVSPRLGFAFPILARETRQLEGAACDDGSVPRLVVPPPYRGPANAPPGRPEGLGRIAPLPGDKFLVVEPGVRGVTIVNSPFQAGVVPTRRTVSQGDEWPTSIEGVAWDERGAVLTCGDRRIIVEPNATDVIELHPATNTIRQTTNVVITELADTGIVVALTVFVVGAVALVPVWLPFVLASIAH